MSLKLAVVCNTTFDDDELMVRILDRYRAEHPDMTIVAPALPWASIVLTDYARSHRLQFIEVETQPQKYTNASRLVRDHSIIDEADALVAFWDDASVNSSQPIAFAKSKGIPILVVTPMGREYPY